MAELLYKEESYAVIGTLFDVYNHLGHGFAEIAYKDADWLSPLIANRKIDRRLISTTSED